MSAAFVQNLAVSQINREADKEQTKYRPYK